MTTTNMNDGMYLDAMNQLKEMNEKREKETEKHKKESLKKSIDSVLIFQTEDSKLKSQTNKNVEILRDARSRKNVEKIRYSFIRSMTIEHKYTSKHGSR